MVHGPLWEKGGGVPLLPIPVLLNVAVVDAPAVPLAARTIRLERRPNGATIRKVRLNGLIILLSNGKAANRNIRDDTKTVPSLPPFVMVAVRWWGGDTVTTAADPHEVVGALLIRAGQVLLCHRSSERLWYPNAWDIPGGHIEAGETPTAALVRELREEVGVIVAEPSRSEYRRLRAADFDLRVWVVSEWIGDPSNTSPNEHDDIGWFSPQEISGVPLAHQSFLALIEGALGSREWDG
jgi:8-oxo-dGTP diphosphatase